MSTNNIEAEAAADDMMCRALCGTAEVGDTKLSDLVQYCSDECQREHLLDLKATSLLCLALGLLIFSSLLWKKSRGGNNNKMSADLEAVLLFYCCVIITGDTMSTSNKPEAEMVMCCASCGTAEVDEVKLKKCPDCDLVRYCSDECQEEHRPKHEAMCKKRAAELRDEIMFRQPESSHYGDCPICFLPLPIDVKKITIATCCSKIICRGCDHANDLRDMEQKLQQKCPFCRHPVPKTKAELHQNRMKRVKANDPVALQEEGKTHCAEGDYDAAFKYCSKAAELGDVDAHYYLSVMYEEGEGVEEDEKKGLYHLEEAAISGHPKARHELGCEEWENGRIDRAMKHWIIAANLGYDDSIQALKECYVDGHVSKEDFAAALRAHQAAVDATKSPQREAAAKAVAGDRT